MAGSSANLSQLEPAWQERQPNRCAPMSHGRASPRHRRRKSDYFGAVRRSGAPPVEAPQQDANEWVMCRDDATGAAYYANRRSFEVSWTPPGGNSSQATAASYAATPVVDALKTNRRDDAAAATPPPPPRRAADASWIGRGAPLAKAASEAVPARPTPDPVNARQGAVAAVIAARRDAVAAAPEPVAARRCAVAAATQEPAATRPEATAASEAAAAAPGPAAAAAAPTTPTTPEAAPKGRRVADLIAALAEVSARLEPTATPPEPRPRSRTPVPSPPVRRVVAWSRDRPAPRKRALLTPRGAPTRRGLALLAAARQCGP